MHQDTYFLGIDGGGTCCRARLTDAAGRVLGAGGAGPGNLALGIGIAIDALLHATQGAMADAGMEDLDLGRVHAGLGMAAGNVPALRTALEGARLPFRTVTVRSDAETACLGAHAGSDGGILILGTGSQGVVQTGGCVTTVGGWGFTISDSGSGATLGRSALRHALLAHEQIVPGSALTRALMRRFDNDPVVLFEWAERARPCDWGTVAPAVFDAVAQDDAVALELVRDHAAATDLVLDRMIRLGAMRISLCGGLAGPLRPHLAARFDDVIVPARGDALDGALLLAREQAPQTVAAA